MKDGCIVSSVILLNLIKKVRFCIPFLLTAIGVPEQMTNYSVILLFALVSRYLSNIVSTMCKCII